ncbi:MAG TPA: DUF6094 domain-containing protein [Caldilineaceae bacterium]|nr:DUF6094 domain-containing protein [Caldilineaceae bacterium]
MRIGAAERLGYYPTPQYTLSLIPRFLQPSAGVLRLLDPCAGQGEALAHLAAALRRPNNTVHSYGIEVADSRAGTAAQVLDHCLHADYQEVTTRVEAFSLLLLNPPYDWESGEAGVKKNRLEYTFLRNTLRRLMPSGVLVYLVPLAAISEEKVARFLSNHFEQIKVFSLPADEFEVFHQVVLFAVRKAEPEAAPAVQQELMAFSSSNLPPALDAAVAGTIEPYRVPASPIPAAKFIFRKTELSDFEIAQLVASHGVLTTRAWRQFTHRQDTSAFTPAMPLRTGHIAGLISSGQIGTISLYPAASSYSAALCVPQGGGGNRPHAGGGGTQGGLLAKGRSAKIEVAYDRDGAVIADPDQEPDRPVAKTRSHFQTRVYTLTAQGEHQEIASVTDLQTFLEQHTAALAKVVAQRYAPRYAEPTPAEWAHVSALLPDKRLPGREEAGLLPAQKHVTIAAARTAKALGWVDLVGEMGTGKTAMGTATVDLLGAYPALVLCPGHMVEKWKREVMEVVPGAHGVIVETIAQLQAVIDSYQRGEKLFVILSKEKAKLGPGWQPAIVRRNAILRKPASPPSLREGPGEGSYRRIQFNACPACGAAVRDADGNYYAKLPDNKRLFCAKCQTPLFVYNGFRRWPLADYIRKKAKGFFQALLADEVHQYKGKATDQARSYGHLVQSVRYTINLTGTLFGGKSLDLFWLRYRVDPAVRRLFSFHDEEAAPRGLPPRLRPAGAHLRHQR